MNEKPYEGERFKDCEAFDYYSVVGTIPGMPTTRPAWGILDEEDGGYIAFCTDEKSAIRIAGALNSLVELGEAGIGNGFEAPALCGACGQTHYEGDCDLDPANIGEEA